MPESKNLPMIDTRRRVHVFSVDGTKVDLAEQRSVEDGVVNILPLVAEIMGERVWVIVRLSTHDGTTLWSGSVYQTSDGGVAKFDRRDLKKIPWPDNPIFPTV